MVLFLKFFVTFTMKSTWKVMSFLKLAFAAIHDAKKHHMSKAF